jgi:hypothetical protein
VRFARPHLARRTGTVREPRAGAGPGAAAASHAYIERARRAFVEAGGVTAEQRQQQREQRERSFVGAIQQSVAWSGAFAESLASAASAADEVR